ncbi:MAG: septum formation initiator family protein [Desulfobacteraceae bacterium]|nr:septum formation initiator family protein [Desulfobacteraceae bacterium]
MKLVSDKSRLADIFLWAAAFVMGFYLLAIIFGGHGLLALRSMGQNLSTVQEKNARIEKKNIALYRTINRLKNDPEYIEHIARQELHMVARDEIVFKFMADSGDNENE